MNEKMKSLFTSLHPWQLVLIATVGAVLITDLITALISYGIWHEVQPNLIALGTINAILVPMIILPMIIRMLRKVVRLEEQNQIHQETISEFERQHQVDVTNKRRADEMALLYQLGISLASGKNLYDTLLALQAEIMKLMQADAFYVAIYDAETDIVRYPLFFDERSPHDEGARRLHERPGLTGAVIFSGKVLYLPDMFDPEVEKLYAPVDDNALILHTFLGVPLVSNQQVIGMLSVQSKQIDAYSNDQIQLMENIALQAAIAIDKARLFDQVQQELAERSRIEVQIHERETILEAVTFAAEQFLKTPDWRVNIDKVLEQLGQTLHVTHAYLFEDHLNSLGEPLTSMRYEWTAPGYPSDLDSPYFQGSALFQEGFIEQVEAMLQGEMRIGNTSTFNSIEKDKMDELGVKSILEVPIFVNEKVGGRLALMTLSVNGSGAKVNSTRLRLRPGCSARRFSVRKLNQLFMSQNGFIVGPLKRQMLSLTIRIIKVIVTCSWEMAFLK